MQEHYGLDGWTTVWVRNKLDGWTLGVVVTKPYQSWVTLH